MKMNRVRNFSSRKGITLTELMVTVFVLGLIAYVMPVAVKLLNALKYQQQMVMANQKIEVFVALLSQDINNCPKFNSDLAVSAISFNELHLYALNIRDHDLNELHYDEALLEAIPPVLKAKAGVPETLDWNRFGRIDYSLGNRGKDWFIIREVLFNAGTPKERRERKEFLSGLILPPEPGHPVFDTGKDNDTVVFDISFYYPFQRKTDPPKRFAKNILKWSNYVN